MRADWPAICRGVSYWEDTRSAGGGHCSKRIIYGNRDGIDYYGSSVVALDARSGKLRWHFQTVHHDVWDYDVACQPTLFQLEGMFTPPSMPAPGPNYGVMICPTPAMRHLSVIG